MRVALMIEGQEGVSWEQWCALADACEQHGVETLFRSDHYLSVEATRDLFDHMRDVVWVNLLSLPSIALPNGIQIVARRFREAEALHAAEIAAGAVGPVTVAPAPDTDRRP